MPVRAFDLSLKEASSEWSQRRANTFSGQANWAGSGPEGAQCVQCAFFGNGKIERSKLTGLMTKAARCAKFKSLTGRPGSPIPSTAQACSYFQAHPRPDLPLIDQR